MARTIKVEGIPQLKAALIEKAAELHAAAVAAVAQEVEATGSDVEEGAPVKTGELRGSVERETGELDGEVRVTSDHAKFVEFGTYKDPAQPFAQSAADKARRRFPVTAAAIIGKALGGK